MSGIVTPFFGSDFNQLFGDLPIGATPFVDLSGFDESPPRAIDPNGFNLIAEVTAEEDHDDELVITKHPVEQGAVIADHAYKLPARVRIRVGWSNSYGGYAGFVQFVYDQLLQLQASRTPFSLWTGKRQYDNMLVTSIRPQTNSTYEFSFVADITFEQLLYVSVQSQAGGAAGTNYFTAPSSNPNNLANPDANLAPVNNGRVSLQTTNQNVVSDVPTTGFP